MQNRMIHIILKNLQSRQERSRLRIELTYYVFLSLHLR